MRNVSLLLVLLSAAGASAAGLTVHTRTNDKESIIYVDGNRVRVETVGEASTIFDADAKKLITLDDKAKTYTETTTAEMAAATAQRKEQMAAAMSKMPPERRKAMENQMAKAMGGGDQVEPKWERTGKDETIAGLACKGYKGTTRGGPAEACFVPWGKGISKEDIAPMIAFASAMSSALMGGKGGSQVASEFERAPGFPASEIVFGEDGKPVVTTRLESLSRGSVSSSHFAVPAGYTAGEKPMHHR